MATKSGKVDTQPVIEESAGESAESTESPVLEVDRELIEATRDIVSRRRRVEELLTTAERQREVVKEEIYLRVTSDYRDQLEAILGEYHPLRDRVVAQLRKVHSQELCLRQQHEAIQDELAELRFRCSVGEFGEENLQELEQEKEVAARRLEEQLGVAEKTYETSRGLLGEDVALALSQPEPDGDVNYDRTVPLATPGAGVPAPPADADSGSASTSGEMASEPESAPLAPVEPSDDVEAAPASPSTAAVERPRLQRSGTKAGNKSFLLSPEDELVLGRSTTCDVVIQGATVSRRHAMISCRDGRYLIEDISSGGGVLVNGERISEHELRDGDEISIGASVFHFNAA